jgi:hypothetical protein
VESSCVIVALIENYSSSKPSNVSLNCDNVDGNVQYELPLLPNDTAVKHFYTIGSGAKCWLDIYHWGAGLAVPGQICDTVQNVIVFL